MVNQLLCLLVNQAWLNLVNYGFSFKISLFNIFTLASYFKHIILLLLKYFEICATLRISLALVLLSCWIGIVVLFSIFFLAYAIRDVFSCQHMQFDCWFPFACLQLFLMDDLVLILQTDYSFSPLFLLLSPPSLRYDAEAIFFDEGVRTAKRQLLEAKVLQVILMCFLFLYLFTSSF